MFGAEKAHCPASELFLEELKEGKQPSTADAFIQVASEFFDAGQETSVQRDG